MIFNNIIREVYYFIIFLKVLGVLLIGSENFKFWISLGNRMGNIYYKIK